VASCEAPDNADLATDLGVGANARSRQDHSGPDGSSCCCSFACIPRRGLQCGLQAREPVVPDLLTDSGQDGREEFERADWVGAEPDDHRRASVRLVMVPLGLSGPNLASISILRLGSSEMNVVVVSLTFPSAFWRKRNVVPGRVGPSGVFTTDSTFGSVMRAFLSRSTSFRSLVLRPYRLAAETGLRGRSPKNVPQPTLCLVAQ